MARHHQQLVPLLFELFVHVLLPVFLVLELFEVGWPRSLYGGLGRHVMNKRGKCSSRPNGRLCPWVTSLRRIC